MVFSKLALKISFRARPSSPSTLNIKLKAKLVTVIGVVWGPEKLCVALKYSPAVDAV